MSTLLVEKERLNETKYLGLYRDLLSKNKGILTNSSQRDEVDLQEYESETLVLRQALTSERNAWILGAAMGLSAFVTIRYFPRLAIRRFGGTEKLQRLEQANQQSQQNRIAWAQGIVGFLLEASLAFWVGYRAHSMALQQTERSYEILAQVPLVKGRSVVADHLCDEWIRTTLLHIPPAFWENMHDGNLKDDKTWRAIQKFSHNCIKRKLYERVVRKEQALSSQLPISLPRDVPDYTPIQHLTPEQVIQLVSDQ
jgi:hypothetical protein